MLQTDSVDEGQAGRSECNQHTAARSSRHSFRPPSTQDRQWCAWHIPSARSQPGNDLARQALDG
jgi:hypothetical protein